MIDETTENQVNYFVDTLNAIRYDKMLLPAVVKIQNVDDIEAVAAFFSLFLLLQLFIITFIEIY